MFSEFIKVDCTMYTSAYSIKKNLPKLFENHPVLSLDTETRSVYTAEQRTEAKQYLKENTTNDELYRQARLVSESSGLSFPTIIDTTHFIFGTSRESSCVVVCNSHDTEMMIWEMIAEYAGLFIIHNSLFDLRIMYERLHRLPKNYVDTALMTKCLINHVNKWKAKTGLKGLMGSYYNPEWALMDNYEPANLKDPKFIDYCAIDGAATYYLWELIQEELSSET